MTEVEKKGIGKAKVGLAVCAVLVVILIISNVWSYTNLQNQINTLGNEKSGLESQVNTLQSQTQTLTNEKNQLQTWLDGNITNYVTQIRALNAEIADLEGQIVNLNDEYWELYGNYTTENWWHHYYKNQTLALKAPKLSVLSVYSGDVRPWSGTPYLHVYGEVWNVGSDTAYNCRLHVILYQGSVVAKDTYVDLGTIFGENKKSVDAKIYYNGDALTSWTPITPEWTTTP